MDPAMRESCVFLPAAAFAPTFNEGDFTVGEVLQSLSSLLVVVAAEDTSCASSCSLATASYKRVNNTQ